MKHKKPNIVIDIERIKHKFTGLYAYCENLALNLEKNHSSKFNFFFFSPSPAPKGLRWIAASFYHKFLLYPKKHYDLWHATWQGAKYIPKRNAIKYVFTIHDLNFLYTDKSDYKKKKLLQAVQKRIDKADAVTVISNYVKEDVLKHLDINTKPLEVIYNGVELEVFDAFKSPSYQPKNKFLFTVGTVLYKKHFHVLPQLLVSTDYELIIAGIQPDKMYVNQILESAKALGVLEQVHLIGSISKEEKYWYMKHCEAFLFPSISEGFGLPPVEAMLLGKPVFLSTFTSLPEIGGQAAYYFNSFEAQDMQDVLQQGLKDYQENNKAEIIKQWANQFTWERAAAAYTQLYQKVLGKTLTDISADVVEKHDVTAIIPTYNEEVNIKAAIESVCFAKEIVVIDSYSTDATVEIAKSMGAKVIQREFDDFSSQKNFAIAKAKYDWIFVLDADERIGEALNNELISCIKDPEADAYRIKRRNYFAGKRIRFSGWQTDTVVRLFNKNKARYNGKIVHEEIETTGKTQLLDHYLDHYTYRDYNHYLKKVTHYADLKAQDLFKKGKRVTIFHLLLFPIFRFISHYFIRLGFLDGFQGFMIAKIQAHGVFVRYNKLWLMSKKIK